MSGTNRDPNEEGMRRGERPDERRGTEQDAGASGVGDTAGVPTSDKVRAGDKQKAEQDRQPFYMPSQWVGRGGSALFGTALGVVLLVLLIVFLAA